MDSLESLFGNVNHWIAAFGVAALYCVARLTTWSGMWAGVHPASFPELAPYSRPVQYERLDEAGRRANWTWQAFACDFSFAILLGIAFSIQDVLARTPFVAAHTWAPYLLWGIMIMIPYEIVGRLRVEMIRPYVKLQEGASPVRGA